MNPIYILGCGARKRDAPSRARDLYTGTLFQASLNYALSRVEHQNVRVLSAKHGLVLLDAVLAPYDATWKRGPCIGTTELAAQIPGTWRAAEFVLLCGVEYRMAFGYALKSRFGWNHQIKAQVPMEGLGIGQQVKWLRNQLKENSEDEMRNARS